MISQLSGFGIVLILMPRERQPIILPAMTFRRTNHDDRRRERDWHSWIATNCKMLDSVGLPPEVYLSLAHWLDFLENGHLHWHQEDSSGFEFTQLSHDQMLLLHKFLIGTNKFEPEHYQLLEWLRVRIANPKCE